MLLWLYSYFLPLEFASNITSYFQSVIGLRNIAVGIVSLEYNLTANVTSSYVDSLAIHYTLAAVIDLGKGFNQIKTVNFTYSWDGADDGPAIKFVDANNNVLYEWFDITMYEASPGNYLQRYNSTAQSFNLNTSSSVIYVYMGAYNSHAGGCALGGGRVSISFSK